MQMSKSPYTEISGKNLLTFVTSEDHEGLELPRLNWAMANKLLPEKNKEQKKYNAIKAESLAVLHTNDGS